MDEAICCDICFRAGSRKLPFVCASDARNQVYEVRLKHGHTLLEHGELDKEISGLLSRDTSGPSSILPSDDRLKRIEINDNTAELKLVEDRTHQIISKAEELHVLIGKAREDMAKKKAQIYRQKRNLEKARNGLEARRRRQLEEIEKSTKMANYRWNSCHAMTVQSRGFLCGEAATIYGLRRLRGENGILLDDYAIGGMRIIDLKGLNSAKPQQITAVMGHVVQLFDLACTYLSIRPPAEITLPHTDYPLPTIFKVEASYKYTDIPFSGTTAPNSKAVSPSDSTEDLRHLTPSRPRPLYVAESLPKLARDDPNVYNSFIEAVCLLAYDIAWVCKSQGVSISSGLHFGIGSPASGTQAAAAGQPPPHTFEDITALGRNLYNLLLGSQPRSIPTQAGTPTVSSDDSGRSAPSLGQYSHGSIHTTLNSAVGSELVKSFKLMSPPRIADQLKKHLMAEVIHAEWELVDEWKDAKDENGKADEGGRAGALSPFSDLGTVAGSGATSPDEVRNIVIQRQQPSGRTQSVAGVAETVLLGGESFASLNDAVAESRTAERMPGINGWTRVKPRPQ